MPNAIKYNVSAQTLSLHKGNFWIGTGDVGKGDTTSTDYWNGITPPSSGYTIYLNKASQGPSIYTPSNNAELIECTNKIIGSQSFTTVADCLNWFAIQSDKMVFNLDYPPKITSGLTLMMDAGFTPSYPTTETTWYNLSSSESGGDGTLTNGPAFSTDFSGGVRFDGIDDYVDFGDILTAQTTSQTLNLVLTIPNPQLISSGLYIGTVFGRYGTDDFFRDFSVGVFNSGNNPNASTYQLYFQSLNQAGDAASTFFLGTYDFSSTPRIFTFSQNNGLCDGYFNGTYVSSFTMGSYPPPPSTRVNMGFADNEIKYTYFRGTINQLDYYNVALTGEQVLANFNAIKGRYGL